MVGINALARGGKAAKELHVAFNINYDEVVSVLLENVGSMDLYVHLYHDFVSPFIL